MAENIMKAGVVGWPVSHSLSPKLHGFWLKQSGIAGEYKAYGVEPQALPNFIQQMYDDKNFRGVNLTIPHKEAVMPLLDEIDDRAKTMGAVNTVIKKNGKLIGTNTDAYGFYENIKSRLTGKRKAVVLGAGGAARAVVFSLQLEGIEDIVIANRSSERVKKLIENLELFRRELKSGQIRGKLHSINWEDRGAALKEADLLVNTTSLGMKDNPPLDIDLSLLLDTALVTDIVYNPLETELLKQAKMRGNPTVDGLGMLLHQAAPAFQMFYDTKTLPHVTDELRNHILAP